MESFKTRISRIAPTAILAFGISAGAWAFLDLSSPAPEISGRAPADNSNFRFGQLPADLISSGQPDSSISHDVPLDSMFIRPVNYSYQQSAFSNQAIKPEADSTKAKSDTTLTQRTTSKDSVAQKESINPPFHQSINPAGKDSVSNKGSPNPAVHQTGIGPNDSTYHAESRTAASVHDTLSQSAHHGLTDTTQAQSDTTSLDSMKLSVWLSGIRHTQPQAPLFPEYEYPLFLYSNVIQQTATFDSTGNLADIRETLFGKDVRIPIQVPTSEYIKLEQNYLAQKTWEDLAHAYTLNAQQNALGSLMQGMTNIDIPIPSNPVLSIFGPPRINLKISGAVDIHGAWQNQKTNAQTLSALGNVTNQPDFKQDVQINVGGTVGDKLSIGANWDTQNQFDYENQLKIQYTGYDDEIIKSVEAGNVSMASNSGFIGSSQALFGIKTEAQFGPLTLTGLASQQKAQNKTLSVSGGSANQTFNLRAYQYSTNHFFIDTTYRQIYEKYLQSNMTLWDLSRQITYIEVWQYTTAQQQPTNARDGVAIMDLPPFSAANSTFYDTLRAAPSITNTQSGYIETGKFIKLTSDQYSLDAHTGVLTLNSTPQQGSIIAVAYQTQDGTTYGTLTSTDTSATKQRLVLKLVKPANPLPSETEAWLMQLRNIYPIGGANLTSSALTNVKILYTPPGQSAQDNIASINLLQLFGVDKTGENGQGGPPDQVFDNNTVCVNYISGEIIFPFLEPFVEAFNQTSILGQNGQESLPASDSLPSYAFAAVYDTTSDQAPSDQLHDRFSITGNYTSATSSHYNLGFNLVQGSVKVLLNGNVLTPDVDYTVDYVTGEVDIRNQAALVPGANVQIQYETNDIFQIASKSLVGLRGDLKVNDQTTFGFTLMNYSIQSPNDKVQLGEEPMNNLILGVDGATSIDLPFLTKALDFLPLIHTAAPSKFNLHAEAAYMLPNPNTRTSVIPDDNGQGVAYVDDFEGSRRTIPLPITYSNWTMSSVPASTILDSLHSGIADSTKNDWRAWTYWYNNIPPIVNSQNIWPFKQVTPDQQNVTVMSIGFIDTVRGQFNRAFEHESDPAQYRSQRSDPNVLDSTIRRNPELAWGGLMNVLSGNATDLAGQNINYVEIWMKVDQAPGNNGVMHVDVGQISEDVFGNGALMTEDSAGLGTLQPGHDFGLDEAFDGQEQARYPWVQKRSIDPPSMPLDPDGDDYYYNQYGQNPNDYTHVNGTENNSVTETGRFPDTEDLLHNGNLNTTNNYFEYNVKLDTAKNAYIVGGGHDGWYQYIIPLKDPSKSVGSPSLSAVQFVRLWFDGMQAGKMQVDIAQMDLLGNYWQVPNVNDSTMQVSTVDIFDDPFYHAPLDGLQPVDHSNPQQPVTLNESSLDLTLNRLHGGDSRYVYKTYPNTLNLFHYKTMKFFVHDSSFNYIDSTHHDADVFIRFGSDSSNFYEYRQPIFDATHLSVFHLTYHGLYPRWEDISIDFSKLTAIKQTRDSLNQPYTQRVSAENGVPGATYWIQGTPSLMSVTYFQIGIANPNPGSARLLSGSVWIDELRLTNVDNTPGSAYRFDGSIQLADIGQIAFNFSKTDPYFHDLTTQFGTLNTQQNWSVSGSLSLDRLLPREWQGTTIPLSYSHSESFANPLYLAGSDILIASAMQSQEENLMRKGYTAAEAAATADSLLTSSQTLSISNSWAVPSMRIMVPSTQWYIRDFIDNITMGYNWSGSNYRNTQVKAGNNWSWNYNAGYSVNFDPNAYFTPFPSKSKNLTLSQPPARSFSPEVGQPSTALPASFGNDFQIRYLPNSLNFSMSAQRSLTVEDYWTQTTERLTPNFVTTRGGGINWKFTNNGIINPTLDYRFTINSTLLPIDYDTSTGKPYPNSYVFHQIFLNNGLVNFGTDFNYSQQLQLTTQPKLPFNIQQFFDLQSNYTSSYQWSNAIQQGQLGRSSGVNSTLSLASNLRLKMLTDPWFLGKSISAMVQDTSRGAIQQPPPFNPRGRGHGREEFENVDTTSTFTAQGKAGGVGNVLDILVKVPFLDFDNISVNFSSTNSSQNGGLPSTRPGMGNFFRVPFIQESDPALGPSQFYQLGLISDPYSKLNFVKRNGFPFFGFDESPTVRIPNAGISDNFSNSNTFDLKTSRTLWQGARIDLSWHVSWSYNRNSTFTTDANGNPLLDSTSNTTMVTGQVTRSFFTIPPVLFFSFLKSGINQVASDYQQMQNDASDARTDQQKLSDAFVKGFETLPLLDKIFGQYMPRLNYAFHWDGLEQIPLFKSFATHVSLDHAYQSTYSQSWHISNGQQGQQTDAQTISYGFQPLLGLNIAFKSIGDAAISGAIQYNTSSQYSLQPAGETIQQQNTNQLSITANYSKKGFAIPLFGLSLQNDVDISASYSSALSNQYSFTTTNISSAPSPINGTNQTTLTVRFQYSISQRVTASIYYTNTKVTPTTPGSPIPGTTTNEAGVDVHISIAG